MVRCRPKVNGPGAWLQAGGAGGRLRFARPTRATARAEIVSTDELAQAVLRIKGPGTRPWHDHALFYTLFATGARPLEVARFEVRDYLKLDSGVWRESQVRAEVAIAGKVRPLHFASTRLDALLGPYLKERAEQEFRHGRGRLIWRPNPEPLLVPVGRWHGLFYHALWQGGAAPPSGPRR